MVTWLEKLLIPARVETEELLDAHDAPRGDVERSLVDLRRINRYCGGRSAWRRLVRSCGGLEPGTAILEIGTGTSDLLETHPEAEVRIGLDMKIEHLLEGRRIGDPTIARVVGDARNLPFRDASVDVTGSSHFFHHFSLETNGEILRECLRVSRRAVFATDTRRNRLPLLFVQMLGALGLVGRITRFDAPASVLQGYTMKEMRAFSSNFRNVAIGLRRIVPFRFALILRKGPGEP